MEVPRNRLMVLLNALHDEGVSSISVVHPCEDIGELLQIELKSRGEATVRFTQGSLVYQDNREVIQTKHGDVAYNDLPDADTFTRIPVASGHVELANHKNIEEFIARYGYADLEAGHKPVMLGIDTNVIAWRLPKVLGIDPLTGSTDAKGRSPTNGYALATGVKQELDWHYRQRYTREMTAAFGPEFERLDNQPAGANREGYLGLYEYRRLRTNRRVDFVECGRGDESIISAYRRFNQGHKKAVLLSNDRGFIERAVDAGIPSQHVDYPVDIPRKATGSWTQAISLIYYLSVVFGVVRLPKATLYGVWNGKDGRNWQDEQIDIDSRSPNLTPRLERDLGILSAISDIQTV